MKTGPNTKEFIKGAMAAVVPIIASDVPTKEMNDSLLKKLLGEQAPTIPAMQLSRKDQHVLKLFWAFTEIHSCIERLRDCETYVSKFPFSGTRVSRSSYLQFVVEGHLHEIYILQTRLENLAKVTARLLKKDKNLQRTSAITEALIKFVRDALGGLIRARGSHVHERRYSNDDIDRLELIKILRKPRSTSLSKTLTSLQRIAAEESHERLLQQARNWNRRVSKVMDEYFKAFNPIVFSDDRKGFRVPEQRNE